MSTIGETADPRTKRTRRLLTQAFADLLREKAFQAITIQDVAKRATVNRATFYAHFDDKHALLNYSIRDALRQRLAGELPRKARLNQENLQHLILVLCEFMAEFHSHCIPKDRQILPLLETSITAELYEVLLSWLKVGGSGHAGRGAPPEVAALVASWAIYGAASQWSRQRRSGSAKEFVAQVLPMIMASLSQSPRVPA